MIPLHQCKHGYLYKIEGRVLSHGVFNDYKRNFIGVANNKVEVEIHKEASLHYGSAIPIEEIEKIPEDIVVADHLGTIDKVTGRPIEFDRPICDGGRGWYYLDTKLTCTGDKNPIRVPNEKLISYIKKRLEDDIVS